MKTIMTGHGAFLTGAEIADVVTAYGLALARAGELDVVDIPFVTAEGELNRVQLRVGWMVETVVTSDEEPADELIEPDTILDLLAKTRALSPAIAIAPRSEEAGATHRSNEWSDTDWDEII